MNLILRERVLESARNLLIAETSAREVFGCITRSFYGLQCNGIILIPTMTKIEGTPSVEKHSEGYYRVTFTIEEVQLFCLCTRAGMIEYGLQDFIPTEAEVKFQEDFSKIRRSKNEKV